MDMQKVPLGHTPTKPGPHLSQWRSKIRPPGFWHVPVRAQVSPLAHTQQGSVHLRPTPMGDTQDNVPELFLAHFVPAAQRPRILPPQGWHGRMVTAGSAAHRPLVPHLSPGAHVQQGSLHHCPTFICLTQVSLPRLFLPHTVPAAQRPGIVGPHGRH